MVAADRQNRYAENFCRRRVNTPDYTENTQWLVGASSVIIEATVSKLQASNEPTVSASERLVVAQANKVLRAGQH